MFGLPFQFDCFLDGLAGAWVGSARVEAGSGRKKICFEDLESISKWCSV